MSNVIESIERAQLRKVPRFKAGDTVRVTATPLGLVIASVPQAGTPESRRDAAE